MQKNAHTKRIWELLSQNRALNKDNTKQTWQNISRRCHKNPRVWHWQHELQGRRRRKDGSKYIAVGAVQWCSGTMHRMKAKHTTLGEEDRLTTVYKRSTGNAWHWSYASSAASYSHPVNCWTSYSFCRSGDSHLRTHRHFRSARANAHLQFLARLVTVHLRHCLRRNLWVRWTLLNR